MSVAFVIPVCPKHYSYMYDFIEKNKIVDIYLIFTNEEEYQLFEKKDQIKKIITPSPNMSSIVTYKKFYALNLLKDSTYDYFIVCDAEIDIILENFTIQNIIHKIEQIYEHKCVYAGYAPCAKSITKHADILNRMQSLTQDYNLYYWFSDLPVFKRDHLNEFFDIFNYERIINEPFFDHVVYLNYLMLYHDFKIVNVTRLFGNYYWSLERYVSENMNQLNLLQTNHYGFSFMYHGMYSVKRDFLIKEGTFLLYHLDRK